MDAPPQSQLSEKQTVKELKAMEKFNQHMQLANENIHIELQQQMEQNEDQPTDEFHTFNMIIPEKELSHALEEAYKLQHIIDINQQDPQIMEKNIQSIQQWGKSTTMLYQKSPGIPLIADLVNQNELLQIILGTIVARLAHFSLRVQEYGSQITPMRIQEFTNGQPVTERILFLIRKTVFQQQAQVFTTYLDKIFLLNQLKPEPIINVIIPLVLNASRALVDNFDAAYRSGSRIINLDRVKYDPLNPEEEVIIEECKELLRKVIYSKLVKDSLSKVLNASSAYKVIQLNLENILAQMVKLLDQIEFVDCVPVGFVTLRGIAICRRCLVEFRKRTNVVKAKFIVLYIHESFHYIFRVNSNDFGWMTPRHEGYEDLEGGYLFEQILFGSYDLEIWNGCENQILSQERWNSSPPMLTEIEMDLCKTRGITNPKHSGLCMDRDFDKEI